MNLTRQRAQAPDVIEAARLSWPWRAQCYLSVQAGGLHFLPHIRIALSDAKRTIRIELYMCSSGALFDEWLDLLSDAVSRGVKVHMLLDAIGCRELENADRERIVEAGIALQWFNPPSFWRPVAALVRDHRKIIVVDDKRAWTGGMGINDRYDPRIYGEDAWLDAMVECSGPIVNDFCALFEQAWQLASRGPITHALLWRLQGQQVPPAGKKKGRTSWARINAARGGNNNPLIRTMVRRILRAHNEVWLCTPYFLPPRSLYRALLITAKRGVRINLALAGPETDHPLIRYAGHHLYSALLDAGVDIYEYQARFMHLKAARVDNWSTLGSFNYDRWNSNWNLEANIEVVDERFTEQMKLLQADVEASCARIEPERWSRRHSIKRWHGQFWYWFGTRLIRRLRAIKNTVMGRSATV